MRTVFNKEFFQPTPSVTSTVTPSVPVVVYEIEACIGGGTFYVNSNFIPLSIEGTYGLSFNNKDVPQGCYFIVGLSPAETPQATVISATDFTGDINPCDVCAGGVTQTPTPTKTPTQTPTKTPTPTPTKTLTPTPTPYCNCSVTNNPQGVTIIESIAGLTSAALYNNIAQWSSFLVEECDFDIKGQYVFQSKPSSPSTLPTQTTGSYFGFASSLSYSYMLTIGYRVPQSGTPSGNIRIAIGSGPNGDCKYGVYDISSPQNGTYYTIRVDIQDIGLSNPLKEIRAHVSTPIHPTYNNCTNPGISSCCYSVTSNYQHPGDQFPPTIQCPTFKNGCLSQIGYYCPY